MVKEIQYNTKIQTQALTLAFSPLSLSLCNIFVLLARPFSSPHDLFIIQTQVKGQNQHPRKNFQCLLETPHIVNSIYCQYINDKLFSYWQTQGRIWLGTASLEWGWTPEIISVFCVLEFLFCKSLHLQIFVLFFVGAFVISRCKQTNEWWEEIGQFHPVRIYLLNLLMTGSSIHVNRLLGDQRLRLFPF